MSKGPKERGRFQSRRQRRIERRKREIAEAAARVFAEKGYSNATIREIADEADMAEGTLYNYFGGKREILLAIAGEKQAVIDDLFQEVSTIQEREDIVVLVEKGFEIFVSELPFTRALFAEIWLDDTIFDGFFADRFQRIAQQLHQFITERMEAGIFRPMDPARITPMIIGLFLVPLIPVLRGSVPPISAQERRAWAETAVDLLFDGICIHED